MTEVARKFTVSRGCQLVGQKLSISRQSIEKWSKEFNWIKRVEQKSIEGSE